MAEKHTCLNCGHEFAGKFCPMCGQDAHEHRYSMKTVLHDLPHAILHVDSGFIHTFVMLVQWPGKTCRGFIEGKRVGLTNPLIYMFVTVGLMTLLFHLFPVKPSPPGKNFFLLDNLETFLIEHSKWSFTFAFLVTSIFSRLMYPKVGFNYIEHALINAYIAGEIAVFTMIMFPIALLFSGTDTMVTLALGHLILLQVIYPAWVYYRTFSIGKFGYNASYALVCSFIGTAVFSVIAYFAYLAFGESAGNH
jgi:hypothetical protein